jgi:hypothetical protein
MATDGTCQYCRKLHRGWNPPTPPQPTLLPFDLAKALAGAPLVTRVGVIAGSFRQRTHDFVAKYPYEATLNGQKYPYAYNSKGQFYCNETNPHDLFLAAPLDPAPKEAGQRDPNYDDELKAAREENKELNRELEEWKLANRNLILAVIRGLGLPVESLMAMNEARVEQDVTALRLRTTTAETHAKALEGRVRELEGFVSEIAKQTQPVTNSGGDKTPTANAAKAIALLRPATAGPEVQP